MPRWVSLKSPLLAAGADEYERYELFRRAESARRAGRPTHDRGAASEVSRMNLEESGSEHAFIDFEFIKNRP
jgi:hypothetical protein